jgi:hypothetical protein
MKKKESMPKRHHLVGDIAYYIFWTELSNSKFDLNKLKNIHRNLEIILNDDGDLLEYRYDFPEEIAKLSNDKGEWRIHRKGLKEYMKEVRDIINDEYLLDSINCN